MKIILNSHRCRYEDVTEFKLNVKIGNYICMQTQTEVENSLLDATKICPWLSLLEKLSPEIVKKLKETPEEKDGVST